MVVASSTAQTSRKGVTMSTMGSGSRICGRVAVTVTTTMRICTWVSGGPIDVMVWENFSPGSKIGTKANGKMT